MTRSSQEPEQVELKRKELSDDGVRIDLRVRWNIEQITVEDIDGESHTEYEYDESKLTITYRGIPTNSAIQDFIDRNKQGLILKGKQKHEGTSLSTTEKEKLIDYETGKAIDNRIHESSGLEEQIAIIRDQLISIINEAGYSVTTEFDQLNTIATEEIDEGQTRKNNL